MHPKLPYFLFLFLCFSLNVFLNAQNQLPQKFSDDRLEEFYSLNKTYSQRKEYALEFLKTAKNNKDSLNIARGYFFLSVTESDSLAYIYSDSIISFSRKIKDHKTYPAVGYYFKGYCEYMIGKNKEALSNFLIALDHLKINENVRLELDVRNAIISIKSNWLSSNEILNYKIELLSFIKSQKNYKINLRQDYLIVLNNLSKEYMQNYQYEKGLDVILKGIEETINTDDTAEYYEFISLAGTAQYYLKNYKTAIDSLQKGLPYEDDHGKAMNNYYLGKSYEKLNQSEKAQFYFLKTDSIYQITKEIFPEMRNAYEHIIEYYKSKNDTENQIKYYDRLLEIDKIIDSTYTYVTETIEKKFDTPQAIAERNRLVEEAKAKESSWKYSFAAISGILLVILGILVAAFRRQRYYKKHFETLMNTERSRSVQKTNPKVAETSIEQSRNALNNSPEFLGEENTSTPLSVKKDIGISEEIVQNIVSQLQKFEASQQFTKQVSLTELSKKFRTNPKYLSKVINGHYQKNFSSYINDLRVEYVVSKLKEDSKFRNYTIKAIAKEAGFGKTESFSKAFHKSTGIKPSYFIKELHKRLEDD